MGNPRNKEIKKKYTFSDNQHTKKRKVTTDAALTAGPPLLQETPSAAAASSNTGSLRSKKVPVRCNPENEDYFILINFQILSDFIVKFTCCQNCESRNVVFTNKSELRMGLACKLQLSCEDCLYEHSFFSSNECKKSEETQGRNLFECNVRAVTGFREIGKGHEGLTNFTRCMNMHTLSEPSYRNINKELHCVYEKTATESMMQAADSAFKECVESGDTVQKDGEKIGLCRVSLDGTWQKRGHASLNGVVTACHGGKCLDVHVMSKHCSVCKLKKQSLEPAEFDKWYETHECNINHSKSSGAMEGAGAVKIFSHSVEKRHLIYHEYLGDGDTSSYKEVVESNPYLTYDVVPTKLECVGHVQKRLGTRLRNKVKELKGTNTPISGKGKLTETVINSLQNFYGRAIRENANELYKMKKSVGAILWHCTGFKDNVFRHRFCPPGADSWCGFKKDEINGTNNYHSHINIPEWIHQLIRPIFTNLADDTLLSKCLHGQTQNANESINQIIWTKCPKNVFVEKQTLEIGVYSAVIQFNDGAIGVEKVFNHFGLGEGRCFVAGSIKKDRKSVRDANIKSSDAGKKQRKRIRKIKKGFADNEKETEKVETYVCGGF